MATRKQIAANRQNATLSTGPKTRGGRDISRRNATKHGLTAQTILLPGEDKKEFDHLLAGLADEFEPNTVLENSLVLRLAGLIWRQCRAARIEAGILSYEQQSLGIEPLRQKLNALEKKREVTLALPPEMFMGAEEVAEIEVEERKLEAALAQLEEQRDNELTQLGRAFIAGLSRDALPKLMRHEAFLNNAVKRTVDELLELQTLPRAPLIEGEVVSSD